MLGSDEMALENVEAKNIRDSGLLQWNKVRGAHHKYRDEIQRVEQIDFVSAISVS